MCYFRHWTHDTRRLVINCMEIIVAPVVELAVCKSAKIVVPYHTASVWVQFRDILVDVVPWSSIFWFLFVSEILYQRYPKHISQFAMDATNPFLSFLSIFLSVAVATLVEYLVQSRLPLNHSVSQCARQVTHIRLRLSRHPFVEPTTANSDLEVDVPAFRVPYNCTFSVRFEGATFVPASGSGNCSSSGWLSALSSHPGSSLTLIRIQSMAILGLHQRTIQILSLWCS